MAMMRLRYVHSFVDKTGRVRFYFRHQGRRWPLPGQSGSDTLGAVIEKYLASDGFTSKAHHTRRQYRRLLDRIKEICGRALITDLREDHVRQIRSRFLPATFTADESVMLISMLWIFAKEHLAMKLGPNPTTDIGRLHKRSWEHEPWPAKVIEKFEAEARPKPNARLALLLLLYTGQRAGDAAAMKWSQYDGNCIEVRQPENR
jgi:integrase